MSYLAGRASSAASANPHSDVVTYDVFAKLEVLRMHRAEVATEVKSYRLQLQALAHQGHTPSNNPLARDASNRLSHGVELLEELIGMERVELAHIRPAVLMAEQTGVALLLAKTKGDERNYLTQTKECARKGETANARMLAQQVVRLRKVLARLYAMDGTERVKGVQVLIEDVDERLARARGFGQGNAESNRELYRYSAELSSDSLRLEWCEAELRRQVKALVQEGHTDAARVLSKGIVDVNAARKRLGDAVDGLVERATSESVREGIRCVHGDSEQ